MKKHRLYIAEDVFIDMTPESLSKLKDTTVQYDGKELAGKQLIVEYKDLKALWNSQNYGNSAKRELIDYKLSRYACYIIVQNSDPRKESVALGQTILLFKHESKRLPKKNTVCFQKTKKDFIKEI